MNYIEQFIQERGLRQKTAKNYRMIIKQYEKYCNMSMEALIDEAENEEEQGIRWKKRTIKNHLLGFRTEIAQTKSQSSVKLYINSVMAVYRHFEIELQKLPRGQKAFEYAPARFEDFLSTKELQQVYFNADKITRAMLLLMATSGITRYDICYTITVGDFIESCKEYLTTNELISQLNELQTKTVIPTIYLKRHKTDKHFYTFTTPETVHEIVSYLKQRILKLEKKGESLSYSDRLFKIDDVTMGGKLIELNDRLGFGKVGAFRKLRPHALRKYHATTLLNTRLFTEEEVDALQGRSKDKIHTAYFKNDPKVLKNQYVKCLEKFCIANPFQSKYYALKEEQDNLEHKIKDQSILIQEIIDTQREMKNLMK